MCGICGFITREPYNLNVLEKMNNTLIHRGPDDNGAEIIKKDDINFGMAHSRLSILDLSEMGHQPMHSDDLNISIVFNGEIYNFIDLREELSDLGYRFRSNTDTEVIVYAYQEWGTNCFNRLNGMFAVAIYDKCKNELVLARDRIGKKPLYYYHKLGHFIYASELKAIMEYPGFVKEIRKDVISSYLFHQYIAAPNTIFKDTFKLEPGTFLVWKNNTIIIQKYWDIVDKYMDLSNELITDYKQAKFQLNELLVDSVRKRMISDVPLGTFLSGGIDSSLVTAIAQSVSDKPIKTYSIGFEDPEYDESIFANEIADYLGTQHTVMEINTDDMVQLVESIPKYYDEPFADASQIPTMLVSQLAKRDVTVALSGDGGDELFCGYNIYDTLPLAQKLDGYGGFFYFLFEETQMKKFNFNDRIPSTARAIVLNREERTKTQLLYHKLDDLPNKLVRDNSSEVLFHGEDKFPLDNWQMRRMLLDMQTYLPEDILMKVDRASMKYSLEARCPILDYRIIEYSFQLPHEFKYYKGGKKRILKDLAYNYIPSRLLDRPKRGFGVPIDTWLKTSLSYELKKFSERTAIMKQGIFEYEVLSELISKLYENKSSDLENRIIWSFYVFQLWYRKYIEPIF
ncbi:asparagine synthase (glutamine-hydrolyzing) [Neobacillus cucumis]|uniref:asparagine synthase (glutamine-hydrolyzing) n=1 Tax=Neobacillus cucumis TaxID=1740721 RepID=UPI0018DFA262|nr:asparagine synthase (glutamine-hydrolyzing) [Neobacillus cucumis]MBI0577469.1 asparagine synthase (glutamine-hydrolyzing) [Neobacillus cucumis]